MNNTNIIIFLLENKEKKFSINQLAKILKINYRIAHTDEGTGPNATIEEIVGWNIRDGPDGTNAYGFTWNSDTTAITGTSDLGKMQINMNYNWEVSSGKDL